MKYLFFCVFILVANTVFSQTKSSSTIYKNNTSKASATVIPNSKGGTDVMINQSSSSHKKSSGNYDKVKMTPKKKSKWEKVKMGPKKNEVKMGRPQKGTAIPQ